MRGACYRDGRSFYNSDLHPDIQFNAVTLKEVFVPGKIILITAASCLLCGIAIVATPAPTNSPMQFEPRPMDQAQKEMQDRMLREANKKRQAEIREQTEKLFQLATELKAAVEKSNENMLSLEVVRKADEVEKLAKKVRDKMKDAIGPPAKLEPVPRTIPDPNFPH